MGESFNALYSHVYLFPCSRVPTRLRLSRTVIASGASSHAMSLLVRRVGTVAVPASPLVWAWVMVFVSFGMCHCVYVAIILVLVGVSMTSL